MARTSWSNGREAAREVLRRLQRDPAYFAQHVLGIRLWQRQRDVAQALVEHQRVAVRSGHKVGKSTVAATLALWWAHTRPNARVLLTAPSDHQVKNILWRELRNLHTRAQVPLGGSLALDHRTGYKLSGGREVIGLTTDESERIAGISSPNLLIIVDEAAGYPEHLFEALFGNLAGGGRILLLGNPTQTAGTFYQAFHAQRGQWRTLHISSLESPCVTGAEPCVPGLATPEWVEWAMDYWAGPDSPAYQVRVLGEFPAQAANAVIGLQLVTAAVERWERTQPAGALRIGVDVARGGDDRTVIFPVRGRYAYKPEVLPGAEWDDVVRIAGRVRQVAYELRQGDERPKVAVDIIGVGGGVADVLKQDRGLDVVEVNVAERATAEGYAKLRDQVWFALRDWLKDGGALPPVPELEAELVAPTYAFDTRGRYKVMSKDEIKKALGRSPDLADALALAVASDAVGAVQVFV